MSDGLDERSRFVIAGHFVVWGALAMQAVVICLVGEPIPLLGELEPDTLMPIAWVLASAAVVLFVTAFLFGEEWPTRFITVCAVFYIWRGWSLFFSQDSYYLARIFSHAIHVVILLTTLFTYGLVTRRARR